MRSRTSTTLLEALHDPPRRQRMNRLNWEINNRAKWDEDVARRSPHAVRQPLTDDDDETKRQELQQLARTSFAWRAFTYFMSCFACQTFWTTLAVFAVTRRVTDLASWLFSASAYSGGVVSLSLLRPLGQNDARGLVGREPCKNFGK